MRLALKGLSLGHGLVATQPLNYLCLANFIANTGYFNQKSEQIETGFRLFASNLLT